MRRNAAVRHRGPLLRFPPQQEQVHGGKQGDERQSRHHEVCNIYILARKSGEATSSEWELIVDCSVLRVLWRRRRGCVVFVAACGNEEIIFLVASIL